MTNTKNHFRLRGITLIELFGALGALAVVLSFASGPLERMSARIEVDVAGKKIIETLQGAQRAAERNGIPVQVALLQDGGSIRLVPEFAHRRFSFRLEPLTTYSLPEGIAISLPPGFKGWAYSANGDLLLGEPLQLSSQVNSDYVVEIPAVD